MPEVPGLIAPFTLTNARVLDGRVVDIVVDAARISAVTPAGAHPPIGEVLALEGRTLIPGLWDAHTHFTDWAFAGSRANLSDAASARAAATSLAAAALEQPTGIVLGEGFRDALWPDAPTRRALDAVSLTRPVVAISADLHCLWLNSEAERVYDVDPGHEGVVREGEAFRVREAVNGSSVAAGDARASAAGLAAAARGIVGVVDFDAGWGPEVWRRRAAGGELPIRVETGFFPQAFDTALAQPLRTGDVVPDTGGLVTMGRLKVILDGSLGTRTAYCYAPYSAAGRDDDERGVLDVTSDELVELLARARAAGFGVAVHAIGDLANTIALDAFEHTGARGSIEHAQLLLAADLPRFAALGVTASVQPEHALDDRDIADRYWSDRTDRAFPVRGLLESGADLAFGSDAPVAPLDPWLAVGAAAHRRRDGRAPWHPEQTIAVAEAIAASVRSTIAPGQVADLVVLDSDPQTASPEELRTMPVTLTMLAGRVTHQAPSAAIVARAKIAAQ